MIDRRHVLRAAAAAACWCATGAAHAGAVNVSVTVAEGKVAGGVKVVRVVRDDEVSLTIQTDRDDELHLHGYNLKQQLKRNEPATLRFVAKRTGRFSAELHKTDREVVVFEIYPK